MSPQPAARILFVDDDTPVRELGAMILKTAGYDVVTAKDATDAIRLCHTTSQPINLLVTDIKMPGPSGIELVENLMSTGFIRRALLTSGYIEESDRRRVGREVQFLQKPFTSDALINSVKALLAPDARHDAA
jgi:CheY-like chemotaxis protein